MKHGQFFSNAYEHDETGHVTEKPEMRTKMAAKRFKKFDAMKSDTWAPKVYGDQENMDVTIVTWGSTTGPVLEAMHTLQSSGKKVRVIQYQWMYPFPEEATKELLSKGGRTVLIEQNGMAQLGGLIREFTGIYIEERVLKNDGRPFYPEEVIEKLHI
jgi:2-oxoglutarate ferredoxin oxidoreductase subunit alpha